MKLLIAWRVLTHEAGRSALAAGGIFIALVLMFLQLGFFFAVPAGGMLHYDAMNFDIVLASGNYAYEARAHHFPRARLYQALSVPGVEGVEPLYLDSGLWTSEADGTKTHVFVMGLDVDAGVLNLPEIAVHRDELTVRDTVLVDDRSRESFGSLARGRHVEINGRRVRIAGTYGLGPGFTSVGGVIVSRETFLALFPRRSAQTVSLGLVRIAGDARPSQVAAALETVLPPDTRALTRDELRAIEVRYWLTRTSTGLVFGVGVVIGFIVGTVVLYQTLATQIVRNLPEYATMKAIGHTDRTLGTLVLCLGLLLMCAAFVPAVVVAVAVYEITEAATLLPLDMSWQRLAIVFGSALVMVVLSAGLSMRAVRRADPADLF